MNNLFQITGSYTDHYQLTMAQSYYLKGQGEQQAIFDYFFRKLPFQGGYAVFAGLENLLELLENFQFDQHDLEFMRQWGFDPAFIEYMKNFRFQGSIYSSHEGDVVFPTRPVLRVEGSLIESQPIETLLLNILNFQTLIATKASRMRFTAGERTLIDFGMRRAHGPSAYYAARAAIIGGFNATSNVKAGIDFNIPVSGTMAHSFIQSFDDELAAFRHFAHTWPRNCILLVDTYNTLKSGLPNAIKVAQEMEQEGERLKGIRLDSGDLAYHSKKSRHLLDQAGLDYVKIFASNQLDEFVIRSLLEQKAPIDGFGVGTSLVTGQPDAALDGVYKLAFANGTSRIKLSENTAKTTLPGRKQVHRMLDSNKELLGADLVTLNEENEFTEMHHPYYEHKHLSLKNCLSQPLLHKVLDKGKRISKPLTTEEIAHYNKEKLAQLPLEYKRFDNPHIYKVGLSKKLKEERKNLIVKLKENY